MDHVNRLISLLSKSTMMVLVIVVALFMVSESGKASTSEGEYDIHSYVEEMQPGWNLGNSFDAVGTDETAWGNPPVTRELIKEVATQGFKSIRIPVTFDQRMGETPHYSIDPDFLERVTNAVDWSLEENLQVMINVHHDSWIWLEAGMYEDYDEAMSRFNKLWDQLSFHFKDYPVELMFESINEPRFLGSDQERYQFLDDLNTSFHEIVRQSGGLNEIRPLVLPTIDASPDHQEVLDQLYKTINKLDDPYLISTVHYYGFWPFSVNIAGYTHFNEETRNHITETFDRVHDTIFEKWDSSGSR